MKYYAHSCKNSEKPPQLLIYHLRRTAILSKIYGGKFSAEKEACICGMLHDIGKYSEEFQQRLKGSPCKVDHSTAGANKQKKLGFTISFFIRMLYSCLVDADFIDTERYMLGILKQRGCDNVQWIP